MSTITADDVSDMNELVDADIPRVDLVGKAANGLRFALVKSVDGNLLSAEQVDELLKASGDDDSLKEGNVSTEINAPDGPVEKADDLDVTEPLAEPDGGAAKIDAGTPGSPAWEAVDAATAAKWASILARAKNALVTLADREFAESATDPADQDNAWNLDDAACAIDYAIDTLGAYGTSEQAEVDMAEEMEAVGKAAEQITPDQLVALEAYGPLVKAGRTLSAANESALRTAADSIQKVLASLPQAPETEDVEKETVVSDTVDAVEDAPVEKDADEVEVAKADPLRAVFDQNGNLIGAVKPAQIVPLNGGEAADKTDDTADSTDTGDAEPTADDMDPAPDAQVGTPAQPDAAAAAPADAATAAPTSDDDAVAKAQVEQIVKEVLAEEREATAALVKGLEEQIEQLRAPAPSRVHTNGVLPAARQLRGQDNGAAPEMSHALELRKQLDSALDPAERNRITDELMTATAAELQRVRATGGR